MAMIQTIQNNNGYNVTANVKQPVSFFMWGWKYFNLCECLVLLCFYNQHTMFYYVYFFLPSVKKLRRLGSPFSPDDAGSVDARVGEPPSAPDGKFNRGIHMFISPCNNTIKYFL